MSRIHFLFDGPDDARCTVALAHGAGAGMDTPFMGWFAAELAKRGLRVARFEFPYMAERRRIGKRGPPDKQPVLIETWREVIETLGPDRLVIGGKSMGGRIASMVADPAKVGGLICLGYPFHPVGKPHQLRVEHLQTLTTPTMILQGTRDPFGNQAEVAGYGLSNSIELHWLEDGDHDFKPRKGSGRTQADHWNAAADSIEAFIRRIEQSS
ncbi:MAG TPA: alpha/beta family hydrolase [Pirellulales bacterium]|nr:alpha/beta family hydrolase [Pirellulales bacterium]